MPNRIIDKRPETHGAKAAALRVLIVDDERFARERLLQLLARQSDIEVVGAATNGLDAVEKIRELKPDIVFLDIRMPELDGFGVLRAIDAKLRPITIFVTAFDQYALQAFEAHGIDYLLKPYSDERFEAALVRAREYVSTKTASELGLRLAKLMGETDQKPADAEAPSQAGEEGSKPAGRFLERIVIKSGGRVTFLNVKEIDWIEAAGVYVYFHAGSHQYLYRATVGQMEKRLDPKEFLRVSRSAIVRADRIDGLQTNPARREMAVRLKNGTEVALTKGYRPQLQAWLGQSV
jgi:two-component system LytT family response regulator